MLKDELHLSFGQAKQRISACALLVPRRAFNGSTIAPRFDRLSRVFNDCTADPRQVADIARKLLAPKPGIDAQQNPEASAKRIEGQLAESLAIRNPTGTGKLLKLISAQLDADALERSEAQMDEHFGLEFKGKQARGFVWELCPDTAGHELLSGLSDQLANPRTQFGNTADASPPASPGAQPTAEQQENPGLHVAPNRDATGPHVGG